MNPKRIDLSPSALEKLDLESQMIIGQLRVNGTYDICVALAYAEQYGESQAVRDRSALLLNRLLERAADEVFGPATPEPEFKWVRGVRVRVRK